MNGYLFTAGLTQFQARPAPGRGGQMVNTLQTWDGCTRAIIYGGNAEQAAGATLDGLAFQIASVSAEPCARTPL